MMENRQNIQWFPGHMAKTKRKIAESLSLVDAVAEIADARIPASSRNPELAELLGKKPRILVLGKSDLADPGISAQWIAHFKKAGIYALEADCNSGKGLGQFLPGVKRLLEKKLLDYKAKGMTGKKLRVMVVGIQCGQILVYQLHGEGCQGKGGGPPGGDPGQPVVYHR